MTNAPTTLTAADLDTFALHSGAVLCPVPSCRGELAEAGNHKHECNACDVTFHECDGCDGEMLVEGDYVLRTGHGLELDGETYCPMCRYGCLRCSALATVSINGGLWCAACAEDELAEPDSYRLAAE